jgi:hypothetical protein
MILSKGFKGIVCENLQKCNDENAVKMIKDIREIELLGLDFNNSFIYIFLISYTSFNY